MIKKFLLVLFLFSIFSCGLRPPKDLEHTNFLDRLLLITPEITGLLENFSMTNMLKPTWSTGAVILKATEQDKIIFTQNKFQKKSIDNLAIAFSSDDGMIEIARDIYFSKNRKGYIVYSFNNLEWFALHGDPREYENFIPNVDVAYSLTDNQISYKFSWLLKQGKNPKKGDSLTRLKVPLNERKVIESEKSVVLYSTNKDDAQINLNENILLVKKGTKVKLNFHVESNIFDIIRTSNNSVQFSFKRGVWIYRNNFIFSISFDGIDYSNTIFSFDFDFKMFVETNENILPEVIYAIKLIAK